MGRRVAREGAVKLLYQLEIHKTDLDEHVESFLKESCVGESSRDYIMDVIDGVSKNKEYIDKIVEKYSKGWKLNRLSKVDLSILRLSTYEIKFRDDIPFNVSVNEAVELAKKYSGEEAGAFINGVLAKFAQIEVGTKI